MNVQIPGLGESVSEAVLIKWHKSDGEMVKTDEPIAELETDKANVDVPSPGSGVIKRSVPEGTKVRIGQTIATIDADAKATTKPAASGGTKSAAPAPAKAPEVPAKSEERLSPAVRRMVDEHQLDTSKIPPTGPGGRIT
jgi:2-oxoglutarate dehydrogenase E2 component (dihydrolipoamide succinyltransferase)